MSQIHRYIVGVDGSEASIRAAHYALAEAAQSGASLKIIHVLEWSPYSFLTHEELEERHAQRTKELERAQSVIIDPIINELKATEESVKVTGSACYGQVAKELSQYCEGAEAEKIFIGRSGNNTLKNRLFGSVPSALLQSATVPMTIVP